jgi:hypothetical protein
MEFFIMITTTLASGLAGAIGSDYRLSGNELVFVEFGGKLSTVKLGPISIVSEGTTTLKGTWAIDFETGIQSGDFTTCDVWWEQMTDVLRKMVPTGSAKIINLGTIDFDALTATQLKDLSYSNLAIPGNNDSTNQLTAGDVFAVATNAGNYTKVKVLNYGYNLDIQWVTYHLGPIYRVLGTGYTQPEDVILTADENTAYITERSGNLLRVQLTQGDRSLATVVSSGMVAPHQIFLDEPRNHAYVVEFATSGRLLKINLTSGRQTVVVGELQGAIGLLITQDLQFAYVSEQTPLGGRVSKINLSTKQRQVIATNRTAPFFMTWVDATEQAIYLVERDPANRISLLDLRTSPVVVSTVVSGLAARPSSMDLLAPGRLLVCSNSVITEVDLGFNESGPLLMGIGFVPFDRITAAGKADTSVDPAYFFQVKDVPFGGTLPLMINYKRAYNDGGRYYQILVDGVIKTDAWSDYEWDVTTTRFELRTMNPGPIPGVGGAGYYPVRSPDDLWMNAWLGTLLNTAGLADDLHTITLRVVDAAGNDLPNGMVNLTVLTDNSSCIATLVPPTLTKSGVTVAVTDPNCGTLKYGLDKNKQVQMGYTASQPHGHATYSFSLVKGVNGLTPPSTSGIVTGVAAPIVASLTTLLGACTVAGFSESLYVAATATTGWGRCSQYDASATIAFVLTPN